MNFDREKRKVPRKREVDIVRLEGTVAWGAISGALDDQLDLKAVLDAKLSAAAFASSEQGARADTAVQPGDEIPWADLSGVPTEFAPAAHNHTLADLLQSGATLGQVPQWNGTAWVPASGGGSVAWADVTGKPSFATVATSGAYADLTGTPTLFDGAYSSLSGIPSTFTPAAHNQAASTISDSTAAGRTLLTAADAAAQRTALSVETTTQLNTRDTNNRARANHTGTQASSTISDFNSAARAQIEAMLVAGTNMTLTPAGSGATRTLTLAAAGVGGGGSVAFVDITGLARDNGDLEMELDTLASAIATIESNNGVFGDGTVASGIEINGGVDFVKSIFFFTEGLARWRLFANGNPETGSNVGCDFRLSAYNDAGTLLGGVFEVDRATQVMDFDKTPTVGGNPMTNGFSHGVLAPIAGAFISNSGNGSTLAAVAQVADRVTIGAYIPLLAQTIDQLGCSISTLLAASSVKLVIYDSDANGRPTTVLRETANIDSATTGTKFASITPLTFIPGKVYYLGLRSSSTQSIRTIAAGAGHVLATTTAATPVLQTTLTKTEAFASAAATWTYANSQLSNLSAPLILMRVA